MYFLHFYNIEPVSYKITQVIFSTFYRKQNKKKNIAWFAGKTFCLAEIG